MPRDAKIDEFICCVNSVAEYLGNLPNLQMKKGIPKDNILELVDFVLLHKW